MFPITPMRDHDAWRRQRSGLFARLAALAVIAILAGWTGCAGPETPAIEEHAYAGPLELKLYKQLGPRSEVSATLSHAQPVEILEQRRVFVRVRTATGEEGWTYRRNLFTPEEIDRLRQLAEWAAKRPSQGKGTVYATLNVHSEPFRWATSFAQIQEGEMVDVVARVITPRVSSRDELIRLKAKPPAPAREVEPGTAAEEKTSPGKQETPAAAAAESGGAVSPRPLSQPPGGEPAGQPAPEDPTSPPMESWTLVRLPKGTAGWVLTTRLSMAIPDEVAQYASGHRITSYFALGQVETPDGVKNHWLWTTLAQATHPADFDSFRVFIYSRQRRRYETAYIERNLRGYYPVELVPQPESGSRPAQGRAFALVTERPDGQWVRKTYVLDGNRVRLVSQAPAPSAITEVPWNAEQVSVPDARIPRTKTPALTRIWQRSWGAVRQWFERSP